MKIKSFLGVCLSLVVCILSISLIPSEDVHAAAITYTSLPANYEWVGNWSSWADCGTWGTLPTGLDATKQYVVEWQNKTESGALIAMGPTSYRYPTRSICPICGNPYICEAPLGSYVVFAHDADYVWSGTSNLLLYRKANADHTAWLDTYTQPLRCAEKTWGSDYITKPQVRYRQCQAKGYFVSYNPNGGTGSISTDLVLITVNKITLPSTGFTRVGYIWDGWAESATGPKKYELGQEVTAITTQGQTKGLYAHWVPITYTIKVYPNANPLDATNTIYKLK